MFKDLVVETRSCRRFQENRRVEPTALEALVDHARLAPCAANLQLLRFSVITDRDGCAGMFPLLKWAGYLEDWDGPAEGERPAAYVVISGPDEEKQFTRVDVGIAAAYIVLAAREGGLGSCMLLSFDEEALARLLPLPPGYGPKLVIALGFPAERVVLEEVDGSGSIRYWRDENGVHHVPKRRLGDIILR